MRTQKRIMKEIAKLSTDDRNTYINSLSLEEVIRCINDNIRPAAITVRSNGDRIIIIRSPRMPEFGFLMFAEHKTSTMHQISFNCFNFSSRRYSVVCACCKCELYGLKQTTDESKKEWEEARKFEYIDQVVDACQKNGIRVLFMRKANKWKEYYGNSIKAIEATSCKDAMSALYDSELIEKELSFIHRGLFD